VAKKTRLNLPQEYSVEERGKDIKQGTRGSKAATIAGIGFFGVSATLSVFLIVFTIIFFFSNVQGPSMMPILNANNVYRCRYFSEDSVVVNRFRTPVVNDIIVTRYENSLFIKRLIAVPGDTIWINRQSIVIEGNQVYVYNFEINGKAFIEHEDVETGGWGINRGNDARNVWNVIVNNHQAPWSHFVRPVTHANGETRNELHIEPGYVFFVGDNRSHSTDSRWLGPQPSANIVGVATTIVRDNQTLAGFLWSRFVHIITFRWV